jgi:hypothetical protein
MPPPAGKVLACFTEGLGHGKEDHQVKNRLVPLAFILSVSLLTSCFFDTRPKSQDVALADIDGDSDLDAFFANGRYEAFESNTVWLNDGTGRFRDSGQRLGKPIDSHSAALGDLDADGDLDALVGNGVTCQTFKNDGRGRFTAHGWLSVPGDSGAWSWTVALGDVDEDGDLDAFGAGCCGSTGSSGAGKWFNRPYNMVWLNDGAGNFRDSGQRLGMMGSKAIALGDLDGDGALDAFVGNSHDTSGRFWRHQPNRVWLNDGRGQFSDSGQLLGGAETCSLALGDVDDDGDLDAFVGNDGPNEVWLNDGSGNFVNSGQALGNASTQVVALADLDGDGDVDAFVGNEEIGKVWLNDGVGKFSDSREHMPYPRNHVAALGDVDGNGALDVFAGGFDQGCRVWRNDGAGHFSQDGHAGTTVYWLAGSGAVVIGLGLLCWWVIRHKWRS